MAADPAFVDTNVLVYANQNRADRHAEAVAWLDRLARDGTVLWVSRQVLREYLAVVTRPQGKEPALPTAIALQRVAAFAARFALAEDGPHVFQMLLKTLADAPCGGRQVHDANIAATMLAHGVTRLITFNAKDFRRFAPLIELVAP